MLSCSVALKQAKYLQLVKSNENDEIKTGTYVIPNEHCEPNFLKLKRAEMFELPNIGARCDNTFYMSKSCLSPYFRSTAKFCCVHGLSALHLISASFGTQWLTLQQWHSVKSELQE